MTALLGSCKLLVTNEVLTVVRWARDTRDSPAKANCCLAALVGIQPEPELVNRSEVPEAVIRCEIPAPVKGP